MTETDLVGAIRLLERGLERVRAGYCRNAFYRRTWFRKHPQFCMAGALYMNDDGEYELFTDARQHAERFLSVAIGSRNLVAYGSRCFVKGLVVHAYQCALAAARKEQLPKATTELLIRAKGFVERGWCRDHIALNANGDCTPALSPDAVAWCMSGALTAAGRGAGAVDSNDALDCLRVAIGGGSITRFNDAQLNVGPVLAAFDRAIAAAPPPSAAKIAEAGGQ